VEEGVFRLRAQDIKTIPRLLEPFRDFLHDMITLMCHITRATRILAARRDARHATNVTTSRVNVHINNIIGT